MKKKICSLISITLLITLLSGCNKAGKVSYRKEVKAEEFAEKIVEKWNKTNFAKNLGAYDFEKSENVFDVKSDLQMKAYSDVVMEETEKGTYSKNRTSNYESVSKTEIHAEGLGKADVESGNMSEEMKVTMTSSSSIKDKNQNTAEKGHAKAEGSVVTHYEKGDEEYRLDYKAFDLNKKEYETDDTLWSGSISAFFTYATLGGFGMDNTWALLSMPVEDIANYFDGLGSKLYADGNKFTIEVVEEESEEKTEAGVTRKASSTVKMVEQYIFEKNTITIVEYASEDESLTIKDDESEQVQTEFSEETTKVEISLKNCSIKTPKEDKFLEVSSIGHLGF